MSSSSSAYDGNAQYKKIYRIQDGRKDKLEKEVRKDLNVKDKYIEDLKEKLKEMTLKAENEYRKRLKAEAEAERAQKIIDALLEV